MISANLRSIVILTGAGIFAESGIRTFRDSDIDTASICQCCKRQYHLDGVLMENIYRELEHCDLFLSVGTSGNVYPAAGFFEVARRAGANTVELNLEPSANAAAFDYRDYGPATEVPPTFVEQLLRGEKL